MGKHWYENISGGSSKVSKNIALYAVLKMHNRFSPEDPVSATQVGSIHLPHCHFSSAQFCMKFQTKAGSLFITSLSCLSSVFYNDLIHLDLELWPKS